MYITKNEVERLATEASKLKKGARKASHLRDLFISGKAKDKDIIELQQLAMAGKMMKN